jgi:hypothetical protein
MRFSEHPTWQMLEDSIQYFKFVSENSSSAEFALTAKQAMKSLYTLQLAVEDKLVSEGESDEPRDT